MGFCQWFTYFIGKFKFTHVAEIKLTVAIQIPITKMEFIRLLTIKDTMASGMNMWSPPAFRQMLSRTVKPQFAAVFQVSRTLASFGKKRQIYRIFLFICKLKYRGKPWLAFTPGKVKMPLFAILLWLAGDRFLLRCFARLSLP